MTSLHPGAGDDLRKHLELIQAVVTRMATASASAKSWLLPVVTAAYGYALVQKSQAVALVGLGAVLLFMFLDVNYLRQERRYRDLYTAVASGSPTVPNFSLDPSAVIHPTPGNPTLWRRVAGFIGKWVPHWRVWLSWSIAPFYGALLVAGIAIWFRISRLAEAASATGS